MHTISDEIRRIYEALEVPLFMMTVDNGKVTSVLYSDGFLKLQGLSRDKLESVYEGNIEGSLFERAHPEETAKLKRVTDDFLFGIEDEYDVIFRAKIGDEYRFIHAVGFHQNISAECKASIIVYSDMKKHEEVVTRITERYRFFGNDDFYMDKLTALPNINYFHQFGMEKTKDIIAMGKTPVIMYYDVDSMQSYNNQYGVKAGDDLLVLIANILTEEFPEGMIVRGADDHFVALAPMESKTALGTKIREINNRIKTEAAGNTTGVHVGVCEYKEGYSVIDGLDRAKLANKYLGDDLNTCFRFFEYTDIDEFISERYIVENFRKAIRNGWIKIYYQCFLRLETGNGAGFEALSRWVDPDKGVLSPAQFIPILEKYHLIHEMDLYIFEKVCSEIKPRYDANLPLLPVSINFSRQDFDHIDVPAQLNRIIERYKIGRYNIDKSYFIIEITEQDMAVGTDRFFDQLSRIRKSGFGLWIDDFGSGYSSLNVFSRFDVDLIKFDMDLLRNLDDHNGANREIIKAMIGVAKKLGVHTLCEGMETEEQKQFLIEAGCELAQGYLYHKPEPLDTIFYRLGLGIPIPSWETEEERKDFADKW